MKIKVTPVEAYEMSNPDAQSKQAYRFSVTDDESGLKANCIVSEDALKRCTVEKAFELGVQMLARQIHHLQREAARRACEGSSTG